MLWRPARAAALLLCFAGSAAGCASKQRVSLDCVPREVTVYVDGRALEDSREVALRTDRPHTVYFKGGGYRTQMVVLESEEVDGKRLLFPAEPCREVAFAEMQPEVRVEVEPEAQAP
jgi:hypothetical protein